MANKVIFYPDTKTIKLKPGFESIDFQVDIYSDGKEDWLNSDSLYKYRFPVRSIGGDSLSSGKIIEPTFFLMYGWQIEPDDNNYEVSIFGNVFHEDGIPVVKTVPGYSIVINMSTTISPDTGNPAVVKRASEDTVYGERVIIDTTTSFTGTEYPVGTSSYPVNNLADALIIASNRGFKTIYLRSDLTIGPTESVDGLTITSSAWPMVTVSMGASTTDTIFERVSLNGILSGTWNVLVDCWVYEVTNFCGWMRNGSFVDITLAEGELNSPLEENLGQAFFDDIVPMYPHEPMTIRMNTYTNVSFSRCSGIFILENATEYSTADIQFASATITLSPSCTGGDITISGVGTCIDNSVGSNVMQDGLISKFAVVGSIQDAVGNEIQYASYGGGVSINAVSGNSGTEYPVGTARFPVNNITDAKLIAQSQGFDKLFIQGTFSIGASDSISEYELVGDAIRKTVLYLTPGCQTFNTFFRNMSISGRQYGETHFEDCEINALSGVHCVFVRCKLVGPIVMSSGFSDTSMLFDCYSGGSSAAPTSIDMNHGPVAMNFKSFSGRLNFSNLDNQANNEIIIDMSSGKIVLEDTCVTGRVIIRGVGTLVDSSNGTLIDISGLVSPFSESIETIINSLSEVRRGASLNNFTFPMISSIDQLPLEGLTVVVTKSIDGGAFAACESPVSELSGGVYKINLTENDLNGKTVLIKFDADGAAPYFVTMITQG